MMRDEGIQQVIVLPFDRQFASCTPRSSLVNDPRRRRAAAGVFVGDNFRFGARQAGDVRTAETLRRDNSDSWSRSYPSVYCAAAWCRAPRSASSYSRAKSRLACRLLERPYWIEAIS